MLGAAVAEGRVPVVVYESTVYPGVTEDICAPILEAAFGPFVRQGLLSGLQPRAHQSGRPRTYDRQDHQGRFRPDARGPGPRGASLWRVTSGGVFRAASIKAAEAAKVIENAQRDINIAFMNEIAQIFNKLDLSIWDVLAAARTKWNFLPFAPGLVGGHCIGVDPYYLSHRAEQLAWTRA
jgi:UDP-N-acetyl-D-galactosamine dehydrogenase